MLVRNVIVWGKFPDGGNGKHKSPGMGSSLVFG